MSKLTEEILLILSKKFMSFHSLNLIQEVLRKQSDFYLINSIKLF